MKAISIFQTLVTWAFLISVAACSSPKMTLGKAVPPSFTLSGNNQINAFQVSDGENVIWKIYPKANQFRLSELGTIIYGQTPASCEQVIPEGQPASALVEGKIYHATAVILDDDALRVSFEIKDGKVVERE
jgi:hypothetical protein